MAGMSGVSAGALRALVRVCAVHAAMLSAADSHPAELPLQRFGSQVIWRNFHLWLFRRRSMVRKKLRGLHVCPAE